MGAALATAVLACGGGSGGHPGTGGSGSGQKTPYISCNGSNADGCVCMGTSQPPAVTDATLCSAASSERSVCCANPDFPEQGSCSCEPWGCSETTAACRCVLGESWPATSCSAGFSTCCATLVSGRQTACVCHDLPSCNDGEVPVTQCALESASCRSDEERRTGCAEAGGTGGASNGAGGTGPNSGGTPSTGGTGGSGANGGTATCVPGTTRCVDESVVRCVPEGTGESLLQACGSSQYCQEGPAGAACVPDVCPQSEQYCDGNDARLCSARGDTSTLTGTCDPASQVCIGGTCQPIVCSSGETRCQQSSLMTCNATGTDFVLSSKCASMLHCVADRGAPRCLSDTCRVVCSFDGGDGETTLDVLGYSGGGWLRLDSSTLSGALLTATENRELVEMESLLGSDGSTVRWIVYEVEPSSCPSATKVLDLSTLGVEGLNTSGPISVPITAGTRYFFGFLVDGDTYLFEGSAQDGAATSFGVDYRHFTRSDTYDAPQTWGEFCYSWLSNRATLRLTTRARTP